MIEIRESERERRESERSHSGRWQAKKIIKMLSANLRPGHLLARSSWLVLATALTLTSLDLSQQQQQQRRPNWPGIVASEASGPQQAAGLATLSQPVAALLFKPAAQAGQPMGGQQVGGKQQDPALPPQLSSREAEKAIVDRILGEGYDKRIRPAGSSTPSQYNTSTMGECLARSVSPRGRRILSGRNRSSRRGARSFVWGRKAEPSWRN